MIVDLNLSSADQSIELPASICFRVTRACNAACEFCQAPTTDGEAMTFDRISRALSWLAEQGVAAIKITGGEPTEAVAARFSISISSLLRWVMCTRTTGAAAALPKRGGWHSPIQVAVLHAVIAARADATCEELRRAYNRAST